MTDIFLICPVRNASEEIINKINNYITHLESSGLSVYYPARDTDQNDLVGYRICHDNRKTLQAAREVHIWYDSESQGSIFDLGMAFAYNKKLVVANPKDIKISSHKSIPNVITHWSHGGVFI